MTSRLVFPIVIAVLVLSSPTVEAQTPEMPEPLAMVVDADGKPMVQVIDIDSSNIKVLFDFGGVPAMFELDDLNSVFGSAKTVYFSGDNCQGDVYMTNLSSSLDRLNQQGFMIWGPDGTAGTYRAFRSTSPTPIQCFPESRADFGGGTLGLCIDLAGSQDLLLPAEEILPNPLSGFHGPTLVNRERRLTVRGGTRFP